MTSLRLLGALLLPWGLGVVWLCRLWAVPLVAAGPALLGYGCVAGMLFTPLLMLALDAAGLRQSFPVVAGMLAALTAVGLRLRVDVRPHQAEAGADPWRRPEAAVFTLLLALLAVRLGGFGLEVAWRPLYPWDAWMNWAPKARVWLEHGRLVPFVSAADWASQAGHDKYSILNYGYPPMVPLTQLWIALAVGRWDESLINLPWLMCGVALALAFYGQLRQLGASAVFSLAGTYLLLSVPALGTHIALAGYADLWVATLHGLMAMAFYRWAREGDRGQGATALLLAAALPFVKRPGLEWALTLAPAFLVARLRARTLALTAVAVAGTLCAAIAVGRLIGPVRVGPHEIRLPFPGAADLAFHPVWGPFAENLVVLANWHLIWLAAPLLLALTAPRLRVDRAYRALWTLLFGGFTFLFVVFFLTERHAEATDFTTVNRAVLHLVPALGFALLVASLGLLAPGGRGASARGETA